MTRRRLYLLLLILVAALGLLAVLARQGISPPVRRIDCTLSDRGVLPADPSPFPPVGEADWTWGPEDAPVTLIAYLDYQCPHCATLAPALLQLRADYPNDLRLVARHLPLASLHDKATLAAQAAEAAGAQGQFWRMHDRLFEEQATWVGLPPTDFERWLVAQAADLGLDAKRFDADLTSLATTATVEAAVQAATGIGLDGTPSLAINGQYYAGPDDAWTLAAYVELIKLEARQFDACPPLTIKAGQQVLATLHTTQGDIAIELWPNQAPMAVNNFLFLAREGWYDGVPFHRVIPEFVAQTGDPSGTGMGGPGYTFLDEIGAETVFDRAGLVGMAHASADANGSQFFITYAPLPSLDGNYTLFGQVVSGMEVAADLTVRDPATDNVALLPPDRILSVTLTEK
jgi:cyclophilin family peptidyl-prolyl cis-trans isomerase/protein-disulfide isomerase